MRHPREADKPLADVSYVLYQKGSVPVSQQEQRNVAMVIVAHPDDAEFGVAGTVATWIDKGWEAYYVICTDAAGGGPDNASDVGPEGRRAISETRKSEQRAACKILGVKDVIFLDYPDGQLQPSLELQRDLVRVLRKYRPTRVVCQSPDRVWTPVYIVPRHHPDHLAAGQATITAIYPAAQNAWDFPELLKEGLLPHNIRDIYLMGAPNPNFAVDISATLERKLNALRAHISQHVNNPDMEKFLQEHSAETGAKYGMAYAEEFHRAEKPN